MSLTINSEIRLTDDIKALESKLAIVIGKARIGILNELESKSYAERWPGKVRADIELMKAVRCRR